jgi:hypothetical protein
VARGTSDEKRLVGEAAAELVEDGMSVGLGTGSTVAFFLAALARRRLGLRCVATSPATEERARELGLAVEGFAGTSALPRLDIAVDGADQVDPDARSSSPPRPTGSSSSSPRRSWCRRCARRFRSSSWSTASLPR